MTETERYSALMSVYDKEKPEYLKASIQSMLDQTAPPADFVIVCDGPLSPGADRKFWKIPGREAAAVSNCAVGEKRRAGAGSE